MISAATSATPVSLPTIGPAHGGGRKIDRRAVTSGRSVMTQSAGGHTVRNTVCMPAASGGRKKLAEPAAVAGPLITLMAAAPGTATATGTSRMAAVGSTRSARRVTASATA